MSSIADRTARTGGNARLLLSPNILLGTILVVLAVLLSFRIVLPVGAMHWDVIVYYDAANRIFDGQIPSRDFFAPVGPLGYYLFAALTRLFHDAQPVLLAHWSLLVVTAPLMALVLADVGARSRPIAFALLVPFLFYALLPFNSREYYPFPGSDAFGIYNRQVCQVLYVLVAGLLFMRSARLLTALVAIAMTALFFLKITGFLAAGLLCVFALAAGRLDLRSSAIAAAAFLAVLGGLQLSMGLVSAYVADILALVALNTGSLAPRFLQAASMTFGVIAPGAALILLLLWADRRRLREKFAAFRSRPRLADGRKLLDQHALWLGVVLFAGIFFETQNTGSQAMIFVWPVVLAVLLRAGAMMAAPKTLVATLALCAAMVLPTAIDTSERAARNWLGAVRNVTLAHDNLRTLGDVSMRPEVAERTATMMEVYAGNRPFYSGLAERMQLPSFVFYSEHDFQIAHLLAADRAVTALRELEARHGVRFDTIMAINFVNPYPWLMDRSAPRHIAIGADPNRAVPQPGPEVAEAIGEVDVALYPTCPMTSANRMLFDLYRPLMPDHVRVEIDACHDAYIHPRLAETLR